ncbi:hypothetical protein SPRG_00119 [Saprolegnia parasitica CBS 223.65]|uniref:Ubiquitin-like domain-containing protein n=1 Tax=Saprolegnia parasitica (strain CBS 223.65) TaxID=695850 RepID=A0A067D8E7_SAPPC|nr:hypothetical protein SPRG_00119 [Saprolegnia parasitica CBS 223.65]KDO35272.1 hypothetical protein SPRG_00119 [Saprolegnia parasitica CBS 223.65]|eukprot:XP_012193622.1 hypothetical protein SPRG_00119 [Saprolegnia parasitica CBS 223.65]
MDEVHVTFKFMHEETMGLTTPLATTVLALKEEIAASTHRPVAAQRLIYKGKLLHDEMSLGAYHFVDGDTIHVVTAPPPAAAPSPRVSSPPSPTPSPSDEEASENVGHERPPYVSMHFIQLPLSPQPAPAPPDDDAALLHQAQQWREETARLPRPALHPTPSSHAAFVESAIELGETLSHVSAQLQRLAWVVNQAPDDIESARQMAYLASLLEAMGPYARRLHTSLAQPTASEQPSTSRLMGNLLRVLGGLDTTRDNPNDAFSQLLLMLQGVPWSFTAEHPAQDVANVIWQLSLPDVTTAELPSLWRPTSVQAALQRTLDEALGLARAHATTNANEIDRRLDLWARATADEYEGWLDAAIDAPDATSRHWKGAHVLLWRRVAATVVHGTPMDDTAFRDLALPFLSTLVWVLATYAPHLRAPLVVSRLLDGALDRAVASDVLAAPMLPFLRQRARSYTNTLLHLVVAHTATVVLGDGPPAAA